MLIMNLVALLVSANPQTTGQVAPAAAQSGDERQPVSDDIVVSGLRDIESKDSAVTKETLGSLRTGNAVGSRVTFGHAQRWARCVVDDQPAHRKWLRQVVDGRTNSTSQDFAFGRLGQIGSACAPDPQAALYGHITDPYYDRGSLVIEALKRYTPDLKLTRAQTGDPAVQARFNAREIPLAKFRLPVDMQYFQTAICFVRLQPELSVRLALTDKPLDAIRRLESAIVNRSRICVGNARRVYADGVQLRFYIADAVYRWAVAAADRPTLIPN